MFKDLHKVFKSVVNELNNTLHNLGESGSEVSHFIKEPGNFAEVTGLLEGFNKASLKVTLKEMKNSIRNKTFLMYEPKK